MIPLGIVKVLGRKTSGFVEPENSMYTGATFYSSGQFHSLQCESSTGASERVRGEGIGRLVGGGEINKR